MSKAQTTTYKMSASPNQNERIIGALKDLKLEATMSTYETVIDQIKEEHGSFHDFLEGILEEELNWRESNRIKHWTQQADFPKQWSLEGFNFGFQPTLDEARVRDFFSFRFIEKLENIFFIGPTGTGKTHLAIALGRDAIMHGHSVRFYSLPELIRLIHRYSREEIQLEKFMKTLLEVKLLIVDEISVKDCGKLIETATQFLFSLFYERHEHGSGANIFTTNLPTFEEWAPLFGQNCRSGWRGNTPHVII